MSAVCTTTRTEGSYLVHYCRHRHVSARTVSTVQGPLTLHQLIFFSNLLTHGLGTRVIVVAISNLNNAFIVSKWLQYTDKIIDERWNNAKGQSGNAANDWLHTCFPQDRYAFVSKLTMEWSSSYTMKSSNSCMYLQLEIKIRNAYNDFKVFMQYHNTFFLLTIFLPQLTGHRSSKVWGIMLHRLYKRRSVVFVQSGQLSIIMITWNTFYISQGSLCTTS